MNRQQRRTQPRIEMVDLGKVTFPWDMTIAECVMMAQDRATINYTQTKHPYHHVTANGAIVDADPTLEYYLKRIAQDETYLEWLHTFRAQMDALIARTPEAPNAIPVNRKFYGTDPYANR